MIKKGSNFFEEHIEKIVLAVVGLVCVILFFTRVLFSPNVVIYDNKKFGPGNIDDYILTSKQAADLEEKLNRKSEPKSYERKKDIFVARLDSAISDIDINAGWPLPIHSSRVSDRSKYRIPEIGEVNEVTIGYIRAVAYVPTEEINEQNVYDKVRTEVNDIDFVTVEAKFDIKGLYERFYDSFAGSDVEEEEWCDPCLAKPIFAAVQLQRREALADGSWGDWQIVPRTRIDHRRKMFEIIEDVEKLQPGGMKVRLYQFKGREVIMDLLQPKAYRIASAREEWFPPSLHKKFLQLLREKEMEEKRAAVEAAREAEMEGREQGFEGRREERGVRSTEPWRRSGSRRYEELGGRDELFAGGSVRERRSGTRRVERRSDRPSSPRRIERERERERLAKSKEVSRTTSIDDIYREFNGILITRRTDLSRMREPLVFWAYDDTVEPEKRYQYRIRLGVFNPIAGTNRFSEGYRGLKNKVILWSEFSGITEAVEVPGRLYFFACDIQEAARIVTVQVSRYVLGYWNSKDFAVKQGEVIGKVVESETTSGSSKRREAAPEFFGGYPAVYGGYRGEGLRIMGIEGGIRSDIIGRTVPETIDYTTGAVLVDVVPVNDYDWLGGKNLHRRGYFDMLYTFDGMNIERMPIRTKYWAKELKIMFNEISGSVKEPREPFRDWGSKVTEGARVISQPEYDWEYYQQYLSR